MGYHNTGGNIRGHALVIAMLSTCMQLLRVHEESNSDATPSTVMAATRAWDPISGWKSDLGADGPSCLVPLLTKDSVAVTHRGYSVTVARSMPRPFQAMCWWGRFLDVEEVFLCLSSSPHGCNVVWATLGSVMEQGVGVGAVGDALPQGPDSTDSTCFKGAQKLLWDL